MKLQYRTLTLLLAVIITMSTMGCGGKAKQITRSGDSESNVSGTEETADLTNPDGSISEGESIVESGVVIGTDASGNTITAPKNNSKTNKITTNKTRIGTDAVHNDDKINMNGKTITIRPWWGFQDGKGSDTTAKRQKEVINKIQREFNCKLNITEENLSDAQLKASILSGKPKASFLGLQGIGTLYDYQNAGCLTPLNLVRHFDYKNSSKYNQTEMGIRNGRTYAVAPLGYGWIRRNFNNILLCNFSVTKAAGYTADQIYKWVNNGKWTWDKFEEVCNAVSKLSGKYGISDMDETEGVRFGFDISYAFYTSMLYSNATDWVKVSNGKPMFNGRDPKAQIVLNQYTKWSNKNTGFIKHNKTAEADFAAGKSAFFCTIYPMPIIADWISGDANNKTGTVPMPKGPSGNGNWSYQYESIFLVVPKGVEDVQKVGAVLDAFCAPLYTEAESRMLVKNDVQKTARVSQSIDQMLKIYDNKSAAKFPNSLYGVAAKLGISKGNKNLGWYDYVGKVANGEMTPEVALKTFEGRCNNVLDKTFG